MAGVSDLDGYREFGWTANEPEILRGMIADADMVASADSVRAFLRRVADQPLPHGQIDETDLVGAHLYLVVAEAKNRTGAGVAFLDLIAAGGAGLSRAAEKYDPASGHPFDAYAQWWIRRALDL